MKHTHDTNRAIFYSLLITILTYLLISCNTSAPDTEQYDTIDAIASADYFDTSMSDQLLATTCTLQDQFWAFAEVETDCNPFAINTREQAYGIVQIRKPMLNEYHRIIGYKKYNLEDMLDIENSFDVFSAVMLYHNPTLSINRAITIWNKHCPTSYRHSVTSAYHSIQEGGEE